MILLDTHTLIWLDKGDRRLGSKARQMADAAYQDGELAVSAISFWEAAMLVDRQRIELAMPILLWRQDLLAAGLIEVKISGEIGIVAATLDSFHGDPADRLITATAAVKQARLVTADRKILGWKGSLQCQDARH